MRSGPFFGCTSFAPAHFFVQTQKMRAKKQRSTLGPAKAEEIQSQIKIIFKTGMGKEGAEKNPAKDKKTKNAKTQGVACNECK